MIKVRRKASMRIVKKDSKGSNAAEERLEMVRVLLHKGLRKLIDELE